MNFAKRTDGGRVLIAGAGPVGMVAALRLALAGVPVTVFERAPTLTEDLRASTFHPPTLDMLDEFGLTDGLLAQGLVARHTQYRDRRAGVVAEFDMQLLAGETAHPYRLQCEQFKLTRLVHQRLLAMPHVQVRFRASVEDIAQDADGITATVSTPEGAERHAGAYVIGADGAWSRVRQALGIEFEGYTYPERFLVASTAHDFAAHMERLSYVNYVSDPDEWCVLLRVPGLWRVLFPTRPEESDDEVMQDEPIQRRLQNLLPNAAGYATEHRTLYRVHQRVAKRYRGGRAFLCGDAAHINNPLGGMGMNGGLHDALNLAEKIVAVHRGEADDASLDRYERQRRPIAVEYINANTARNKKTLEERDPAVRARSQEEMRRTAEDPVAARAFLRRTSMIEALAASAAIS
jgi:3-(3-hydroxy-phenyl)propionate hydroxylase